MFSNLPAWIWPAIYTTLATALFNASLKMTDGEIPKAYSALILQLVALLPAIIMIFFSNETIQNSLSQITNKGLIYSILAGLIIGVANIAILAMYHYKAPLSVAVPITRTGGMLLTVVLGILLFSEILTIKQVIGIILGIISILFLI